MKIAILGTGSVGSTIGSKLVQQGHEVKMGSRTSNNEKATAWAREAGGKATIGSFSEAAAWADFSFNCTSGMSSLEALRLAGEKNLAGKLLIDVANALDFSKGMPPTLAVSNTDSLGEQIQRAFPEAKVVKALNTLNADLMVSPGKLKGEHDLFICGNDAAAKKQTVELLQTWGWKNILDLGDITNARGTEMILPLWVRLYGHFQSPDFNFHITR